MPGDTEPMPGPDDLVGVDEPSTPHTGHGEPSAAGRPLAQHGVPVSPVVVPRWIQLVALPLAVLGL